MQTKAKLGIFKPKTYATAATQTLDLVNNVPHTIQQNLSCPHWKQAMMEEFVALQRNHTWSLVSLLVILKS